ncbi:glycosyltransferase family 9 protein [Chitinophaga sancti]|uniref:glycosyltransferase family 9 protein n=1 Tax=Chitinophaga sancti TaxID=1004 RepID=UPI003F793054
MKTLLAIRFSAMGDVAMTIPVLQRVLQAHPDVEIVFVSNKNWGALCEGIPRLHFFPADLKGAHKGVKGLYRLFKAVRAAYRIDAVADLHQVLRSQIVRTFFRLTGRKVAVIDKGRAGKKALARQENKVLQPLRSTIERYADVFRSLGFSVDMSATPPVFDRRSIPVGMEPKGAFKWIGLAPFATYVEKTYPFDKIATLLGQLVSQPNTRVLLMGGGAGEVAKLQELAERYPQAIVVAGRFKLPEELAIISQMDVMISMDSANMHLASLFGVSVVSVWGATHPFAGFMGYGQRIGKAAQIELGCRPCSIFGNKPCFRGDHACMEQLPVSEIIEKI